MKASLLWELIDYAHTSGADGIAHNSRSKRYEVRIEDKKGKWTNVIIRYDHDDWECNNSFFSQVFRVEFYNGYIGYTIELYPATRHMKELELDWFTPDQDVIDMLEYTLKDWE